MEGAKKSGNCACANARKERIARAHCTDAGRAALDKSGTLRHGAGTFDFGEWSIRVWAGWAARILRDRFERPGCSEKRYRNIFPGLDNEEVWFLRSPRSPTLSRAVQRTNLVRRSSIGKLQLKTALSSVRYLPTLIRNVQHTNPCAVFLCLCRSEKSYTAPTETALHHPNHGCISPQHFPPIRTHLCCCPAPLRPIFRPHRPFRPPPCSAPCRFPRHQPIRSPQ